MSMNNKTYNRGDVGVVHPRLHDDRPDGVDNYYGILVDFCNSLHERVLIREVSGCIVNG